MNEEKTNKEKTPTQNQNPNETWSGVLKRVVVSTLGKDSIRNDVILTTVIFFLFQFLKEGLIEDVYFFNSLKWLSSLIVVGTGAKYFKEEANNFLNNKKNSKG